LVAVYFIKTIAPKFENFFLFCEDCSYKKKTSIVKCNQPEKKKLIKIIYDLGYVCMYVCMYVPLELE
jgi:hypothetical protein